MATARGDDAKGHSTPELGAGRVVLSVWFAAVGEQVLEGDRLVEVLADGATFDVASPANGHLYIKHIWPGDPIEPGQCLGEIETEVNHE